jgi:hypothetical protein
VDLNDISIDDILRLRKVLIQLADRQQELPASRYIAAFYQLLDLMGPDCQFLTKAATRLYIEEPGVVQQIFDISISKKFQQNS